MKFMRDAFGRFLIAGFLAASGSVTFGHEFEPGVLYLRENANFAGATGVHVMASFKSPNLEHRMENLITPKWPKNCKSEDGAVLDKAGFGEWTYRKLECDSKGLRGQNLAVVGMMPADEVILRIDFADGSTFSGALRYDESEIIIPDASRPEVAFAQYVKLGCEHIFIGFDHLLFLVALVCLVRSKRRLIEAITAFTLAHSVTLSLAALGFVAFPSASVEAFIALSIVYLCLEIVNSSSGYKTWTQSRPWIAALMFGLLHGFGFAGSLINVGLPERDFLWALFGFNVGVEAGQLAFVVCVLSVWYLAKKCRPALSPTIAANYLAYGMGSVACFWCIQRMAAVFDGLSLSW